MLAIPPIYGVRLTPREKDIRSLIAAGLSSKQIAERLSISLYTVANHRKSILKKKGVRSLRNLAPII